MKTDKQVEKLQKIIYDARQELNKIEDERKANEIKPLLDKCYRYRNNYSCPEKDSDYWWIYMKIIKIDGPNVTSMQFQTDKYGKVIIVGNCSLYGLNSGWEEITNTAFIRAWKLLFGKLTIVNKIIGG